MKKQLFTLAFLLTFFISFSQNSHVVIKGKVENELKEQLSKCNLQVFKDDNLVKVDTTGAEGTFTFDSLYVGHVYDLYFVAEGYSIKFVRIDEEGNAIPIIDRAKNRIAKIINGETDITDKII